MNLDAFLLLIINTVRGSRLPGLCRLLQTAGACAAVSAPLPFLRLCNSERLVSQGFNSWHDRHLRTSSRDLRAVHAVYPINAVPGSNGKVLIDFNFGLSSGIGLSYYLDTSNQV